MFKSLFGKGVKQDAHDPQTAEEKRLLALEGEEIERALTAMDAVLDGQVDIASKLTSQDNLLFTKVATGVLRFIEATVSFEPEAIHKAVEALSLSEHMASQAKTQAHLKGVQTSSFRPGSEYELAEYESGLLAAISMLLTEGKIEILKALYKIRKTYLSLEELRKHVTQVKQEGLRPKHTAVPEVDLSKFREIHAERTKRLEDPEKVEVTPADTIEEYILSGVETMSGLLHLILSSVPPNIARLLSVIGLHGEREAALELMWHSASTYQNIHGSLALIALIMFFDGQFQYVDIQLDQAQEDKISDLHEEKHAAGSTKKHNTKTTAKMTPRELRETRAKLAAALRQQRLYYPHGVIWLLQEGRLVTHEDLPKGVAILESDECGPNQMRQVEGLLIFDRTMFLLSLNRLQEASEAFIQLMKVSTWSHPLYMYMAASCELEMFRASSDPTSAEAQAHKAKAEEYFAKAPEMSGKKKVLGKKMPFDGFVVRKVGEFKATARRHNLSLADSIATSPLYEALYFWNGPWRMSPELAEHAVKQLNYSAGENAKFKESEEDKFTRLLLEATYMRRVGPEAASKGYKITKKLASMVVSGDIEGTQNKRVTYHPAGEPWAGPACLYERAVSEWTEMGPSHAKQVRRFLTLSADWHDDYELSTRINMKITGARDRLDIYRM